MNRIEVSNQRMADLILGHGWDSTPMGSAGDWPESLKLLVSVMLSSQQPMFVMWGADHRLIYNDEYAEILANKHPAALGMPFLDVWNEIRTDLRPIVDRGMAGEPIFMDDIELQMMRRGYLEETHFSFSYTPVRSQAGDVDGIFCPCVETTQFVLTDRSLREREKEISEALEVQKGLLEQKDMLLAEVNHRVKNSLQLVSSALSLQARRLKEPATKAAFDQAINRVRAISSVHERLYKSDNPMFVSMPGYLKDLAEDLETAPELTNQIDVVVDDIRLRTELAIPVALIVNELVTNAIKYAYPPEQPGPIKLSLVRREDEMLELSVADKGAGMETLPTTEGLGSRLVAAMASQVQGRLERNASEDGFSVTVVFPAGNE